MTTHPTMRRMTDKEGPDFYPTPAWATRALLDNETFDGPIWEPACGDGAMAKVLAGKNFVLPTDLYDRGYGQGGIDFFLHTPVVYTPQQIAGFVPPNIVSNPPFNQAEAFVQRALSLATGKVAFLLRLAFLEGAGRERTLFSKTPPTRVWVFSERITFYPGGVQTAGSGTLAYAWFVWDKQDVSGFRNTELRWLTGYKGK